MSNQRIIQLDLFPFQLSSLFHMVSLWIDFALFLRGKKKCIELQLQLIRKLTGGTKTFLGLLKKELFHMVTSSLIQPENGNIFWESASLNLSAEYGPWRAQAEIDHRDTKCMSVRWHHWPTRTWTHLTKLLITMIMQFWEKKAEDKGHAANVDKISPV